MRPALDRLVSVPANIVPEDSSVTVLRTHDGVTLRSAYFGSPEGAAGTVLLLPGRAEFIEKYLETVADLRQRGFCVAVLDWRGQGGSSRSLANPFKGHVDDFASYGVDLDCFLDHLDTIDAPRPWYGLAHSMGGSVLLAALAAGEARLNRAVLSAPMLGIHAIGPGHPSARLAQGLNLIGLGGAFVPFSGKKDASAFAPFEGNLLTSDPRRYERQVAILTAGEALALGPPTLSWVAAAFRLIRAMHEPSFGLAVRCPTLFVGAGADTIVSTPDVERLARRIRGGSAVIIEGARHELLMEADRYRNQFWAAFDAFIH